MSQADERPRPRALILAAGAGRRLRPLTTATPKALVPVGRRALIDYTLEALDQVGIREAIVVTGHREDQLREALRKAKHELRLLFVSNPDYQRGASLSVRSARSLLGDEPFLLVVADHLLSAGLLKRLLKVRTHYESSLLACDFSPAAYHDLAEATRVRVAKPVGGERPAITAIGKGLAPYDALDTGAFLLQPQVWDAIEMAPYGCELSEAIAELIRRDPVLAVDVTGEFWFDVDTTAELAVAARLIAERERGVVA